MWGDSTGKKGPASADKNWMKLYDRLKESSEPPIGEFLRRMKQQEEQQCDHGVWQKYVPSGMEPSLLFELIGYLASVLVAVSLTMSNIVRLRVLNMLGAITFVAYGALIGAWPVAFMNAFIVGINIYYLLQMRNTKEYLKLVTTSADDEFLNYVLSFHHDAIAANQPEFRFNPSGTDVCALVLRDTVPAGIFIGKPSVSGEMSVKLDFVPPAYRDFKIGSFLFSEKRGFFQALGVTSLRAYPGDAEHTGYLLKMGFEAQADGSYLKRL